MAAFQDCVTETRALAVTKLVLSVFLLRPHNEPEDRSFDCEPHKEELQTDNVQVPFVQPVPPLPPPPPPWKTEPEGGREPVHKLSHEAWVVQMGLGVDISDGCDKVLHHDCKVQKFRVAIFTNCLECSNLGHQDLNNDIWLPAPHLECAHYYDVWHIVWHGAREGRGPISLAVPFRHCWRRARLSTWVKPHNLVELSYKALKTAGHSSGDPEKDSSRSVGLVLGVP